MADWERMYARQDYLTIDLLARRARPDARTHVLDIAPGKGEGAVSLAERFGCRVTAIDLHDVFARATRERAATRRMAALVDVVRGDGGRLPFGDGTSTRPRASAVHRSSARSSASRRWRASCGREAPSSSRTSRGGSVMT